MHHWNFYDIQIIKAVIRVHSELRRWRFQGFLCGFGLYSLEPKVSVGGGVRWGKFTLCSFRGQADSPGHVHMLSQKPRVSASSYHFPPKPVSFPLRLQERGLLGNDYEISSVTRPCTVSPGDSDAAVRGARSGREGPAPRSGRSRCIMCYKLLSTPECEFKCEG